jgi:hypothetical protein
MNPPKASQPAPTASSKTNKEKFTELVAYMQKHKGSSVIFTSVSGPTDTGFEYEEQKAFANGDEYNLSLEVECKSGNLFFIHLDMDGKRIATKSAVGWEDLLLKIKTHFYVPKMGSPEYKSLTESVSSELNEWKYINPPKASQPVSSNQNNYPSQEDRYKRLLAQIDADGISAYTVHELNDTVLDMTTDTKSPSGLMTYRLRLTITYYPDDDYYTLKWDTKEHRCEDFEDALKILIKNAVIVNTDLCESAGSIADDFKAYENLWD